MIRSSDGRHIEIGEGIRGAVEHPVYGDRILRLSGWALEARGRRPVDRVLVFLNGRLVYEAHPRELHPRIATLLDIEPFDLGWRAEIPREQLRGRADVRVYGVAGSTASLLPFSCVGGLPEAPGCPPLTLGERSIGSAQGRAVRIGEGGIEGVVDESAVEGARFRVVGWAMRSDSHRPVDRIVAFARDRFLFATPPQVRRGDVGSKFDTDPDGLGFVVDVPSRLVAGSRHDVRVFALAGRTAVPLDVP